MKKKQLKIDAGMMREEAVMRLVEEEGMSGLGIYVALLLELEKRPCNTCTLPELRSMERRLKVNKKKLCNVVYGYGLFRLEEQADGQTEITSVYLNEEKKKREKKEAKRQMKKSDSHASVPPAGHVEEEKNSFVADSAQKTPSWEAYIDRATEDRGWLEAVAMNNKLPVLDRLEEIMALFKRHVRAQGSETGVDSVQEAKRYFANYARAGTPTNKRLMEALRNDEETHLNAMRQKDPHRYEDVDPVTGQRSYYGIPIPPDAPPRPDGNAVWHVGNSRWEM